MCAHKRVSDEKGWQKDISDIPLNLDSYDLSIVSELSTDASQSVSGISGKIHLSRQAVAKRITDLIDQGYIDTPKARIDYEKLGFTVHTFVYLKSPSKSSYDLLDRLMERPEVLTVSVVIGDGIMLVELIAIDRHHLHHFLDWVKDFADSVTHYVLKQHLSAMNIKDRLRAVSEIAESMTDRT